jgi:hypothetical protein
MDTKTQRAIWQHLQQASELAEAAGQGANNTETELLMEVQSLAAMWGMAMVEARQGQGD